MSDARATAAREPRPAKSKARPTAEAAELTQKIARLEALIAEERARATLVGRSVTDDFLRVHHQNLEYQRVAQEAQDIARQQADVIARQQIEIDAKEQRIATILSSSSWRLTAPLRALMGLMSGKKA